MWSKICPRIRSALFQSPTWLSKCSVSPIFMPGAAPGSCRGSPIGIRPVDGGCFSAGGVLAVGVIRLTIDAASGDPSLSRT